MLRFGMNMPLLLMMIYGSSLIGVVLAIRALLKKRMPKFVFPVLWALVMVRFLVPLSLSTPISVLPGADMRENSWLQFFSPGFGNIDSYAESTGVQQDSIYSGTRDPGHSQTLSETVPQTEDGKERAESSMAVVEEAHDAAQGRGEPSTGVHLMQYGFRMPEWRLLLFAIWLGGMAAVAGVLIWQKFCYSQKLKNRLLIEHNETVNGILRGMGMGHVLVFTNDEIASPLVCGLVSPRIYLPTRMDFQNKELLSHVLAHECMHIKRRDNWMKAAMLLVLCVNWFNPLVWIMSKFLSADLEAACDGAVLQYYQGDERKSYAASLLAMAVTGNRTTLLYSAFSRTEVERRIKNVLAYKRMSVMAMLLSVLLLGSSMVVFAAGCRAPFSEDLSSFCFSSNLRWGVRATLSRDIVSGEKARERADNVILDILKADTTKDPQILEEQIKAGLAEEFGVEKGAFIIDFSLLLEEEERNAEYESWGLTRGEDGFFLYKGERVRTFADEVLGFWQSTEEGAADVQIQRDRFGYIISVSALHQGDEEYDRRTREIERNRSVW